MKGKLSRKDKLFLSSMTILSAVGMAIPSITTYAVETGQAYEYTAVVDLKNMSGYTENATFNVYKEDGSGTDSYKIKSKGFIAVDTGNGSLGDEDYVINAEDIYYLFEVCK